MFVDYDCSCLFVLYTAACSTVLVPDRVVQALNLNLKPMDASAQLPNKSNTTNAAIIPSDHGVFF